MTGYDPVAARRWWSAAGSRLLLQPGRFGLRVSEAVYELHPERCVLIEEIRVFGPTGADVGAPAVDADGARWAGGHAVAVVAGVGPDRPLDSVLALRTAPGCRITVRFGLAAPAHGDHEITAGIDGSATVLIVRTGHDLHVVAAAAEWVERQLAQAAESRREWTRRCPVVAPRWQPLIGAAWDVLHSNTIHLPRHSKSPIVVPAKSGYVAGWQWDSYFAAIGLRHGSAVDAAAQVEVFLDAQQADGSIPDVLHDHGQIRCAADLPVGELAATAAKIHTDPADPALLDVPITKPPLAAWAAQLVAESRGRDLLAERPEAFDSLRRWWLGRPTIEGLPAYDHPYSSGLDDSPLFDAGPRVSAPDLTSYLVLEADLMADRASVAGDSVTMIGHQQRAERLTRLLLSRWDPATQVFTSASPRGRSSIRTPLTLLPLLTGRLPGEIVSALLVALDAPDAFGTPVGVPTVGAAEETFDPDRMWRGPVWANMNWLTVQGLRRVDQDSRARALARDTLAAFEAAGDFPEYLRPDTGRPASHAVLNFSWSAALTIDLAVQLSTDPVDRLGG